MLHELYDAWAARSPDAPAVVGLRPPPWPRAELSYAELRRRSLHLAAALRSELGPQGAARGRASRGAARDAGAGVVVAVRLARHHPDFLPLLVACSRSGATLALLSTDLREKDVEEERNSLILEELCPSLLVVEASALSACAPATGAPAAGATSVPIVAVEAMLGSAGADAPAPHPPAAAAPPPGAQLAAPLAFLFTGGSTRARCVAVSHAMVAHESRRYPECVPLAGRPRVLAQTSVYWGASALGQLSIALAYGGCAVLCEAHEPEELRDAVLGEGVHVIGLSPAQLSTLAERPAEETPDIQLVFTWGEPLPPAVAEAWRGHPRAQFVDLLISTECWLALYARQHDAEGGRGLRAVGGVRVLVLGEDGCQVEPGEVGELLLAGPMVTPGYVPLAAGGDAAAAPSAFFHGPDGERYLRTRDLVRVVQAYYQ